MSLESVKTENDFNNKIKDSKPTLVGFFSPKCDFCNMFLPVFEANLINYPMIQFLKVRPSEIPSVFSKYSIKKNGSADLPQVGVFRNGQMIAMSNSILNENSLRMFIKNNVQ